ncbi:MAG TPA: hypothetical protein VFS92_00120 [Planctomycetota bacterium]|nr:hypothetical protein [Planctomycetota bacterium]
MPLDETAALQHYDRILRSIYGGRRFLLFGGPLAAIAKTARALHGLGAASTFLLGDSPGTGDPPEPHLGPTLSLGIEGRGMMDAFRKGERTLLDLPAHARAAIDRWDPAREARALGFFTLSSCPAVAGRRRFADRPNAWRDLEDKTRVDAFWDEAGVARAPSEVVPIDLPSLRAAAKRLDRGAGTAWVGDAREGVHGGAEVLRRVVSDADAGEAAAYLGTRCDRARVMPFLEGIPCSIHGIVFPGGGTSVLRPVEMVTLRRRGSGRLLYAGTGTFFDPAPADRDAMRATARRVGEVLHRRLGYLGGFTIDGVLAAEGWLPTEMNPRPGAGHNALAASVQGLPIVPLLLAAQEGVEADWRPELLEDLIVTAADRTRSGAAQAVIEGPRTATEKGSFAEPAATWEIGPSPSGGFVRVTPAPGAVAPGDSLAPFAVRALAAADALLGTGLGPLEAAVRVR